ncbi:hypothetical protein ANN_14314 [Periplaneta americana]|uniref:Reverse transcriptase n=1 Tax=Periplaneta americana TaxID=6978 RepID=A0ABQ8SVZ5_PERAM|nr:hypothetical protein ANN_14314 [Periplaneta americana]
MVGLSIYLSAVRSVPGRSFNTTRCRHPSCNETETLGHVLGFCRKTELLRNNPHHKARTGIADVLKRRGWTQSKGLVLDPTIRFERDALQAQHVDEEKKSIYESCIPYLSEKYNIPTSQWSRLFASQDIQKNEEVYVVFVDTEKAFDRVDWNKLMGIIKKIGVNWNERRLISTLYMKRRVKVRIGEEMSEGSEIERGVRQDALYRLPSSISICNLPKPGTESGPPGFSARRANRYFKGVDLMCE